MLWGASVACMEGLDTSPDPEAILLSFDIISPNNPNANNRQNTKFLIGDVIGIKGQSQLHVGRLNIETITKNTKMTFFLMIRKQNIFKICPENYMKIWFSLKTQGRLERSWVTWHVSQKGDALATKFLRMQTKVITIAI